MQVHCENGRLIEALVDEAQRRRAARPGRVRVRTCPPEVEEEAVARVLAAAALAGAESYLVHLSSSGALSQVRLARGRRRPRVYAEVCLHHLLLDDRHHDGPDAERYLVCPPLRGPTEPEAIWEGVGDGTVDVVASDHAQLRSRTPEEISLEGVTHGYGLAGIGPRLALFVSEGRARGLPLRRLVELACSAPARIFGHHPQKGVITPGADADLVVWDPDVSSRLEVTTFDDGTGDSVFAGRELRGRIRAVLACGRLIVNDGHLQEGLGRYLPAASATSRT